MKKSIFAFALSLSAAFASQIFAQTTPDANDPRTAQTVRLTEGFNVIPVEKTKSTLRILVRNGEVTQVMEQTSAGQMIKGNVEPTEGAGDSQCSGCGSGFRLVCVTVGKGWSSTLCVNCQKKKSPNSSSNATDSVVEMRLVVQPATDESARQ